jgi:hypothetical protein
MAAPSSCGSSHSRLALAAFDLRSKKTVARCRFQHAPFVL